MADTEIEDGTEIDRDRIDLEEDVPYAKLMEMLKDDGDRGDDVAFGAGDDATEPPVDVVSVEDGVDLIEEAQAGQRKAAKVEAEGANAETAPKGDEAPETQAEASPEPRDEIETLLDGLPDDRKATIRSRIGAADELMGIFKGREAELERHGVKPAEAVKRLIDINAYATREPEAYLAWAATQFGDPREVLAKAAEKLGLKLAPEAEFDDDPFEDAEVKEMRARLARYEAQERAPLLGPDTPQAQAQADLQRFAAESKHWQAVGPQVAAMASAHVQSSGKPATMDDIRRFYDASVIASGLAQSTPAAQPKPAVAEQAQNTTAATSGDHSRAKAASKSLDGSGHGAGRRPALSQDASLEDVVGHLYREFSKG